MRRSRSGEEQIISVLKEQEAGMKICRPFCSQFDIQRDFAFAPPRTIAMRIDING
jgi:hypothetical protein